MGISKISQLYMYDTHFKSTIWVFLGLFSGEVIVGKMPFSHSFYFYLSDKNSSDCISSRDHTRGVIHVIMPTLAKRFRCHSNSHQHPWAEVRTFNSRWRKHAHLLVLSEAKQLDASRCQSDCMQLTWIYLLWLNQTVPPSNGLGVVLTAAIF